MSADSGPGTREIARRLFAAEFDDASLSYSESDEERAPNYVVTPTGARVNRLFAVGVLTEIEQVNEDSLRGRVVDPTGAFVTYAGQYQPDEHAFLNRMEPPTFVALAGKARTFEPEDSDRVFTSVRPESLNEVDADTRDRWVVSAARRTLNRIAVFAAALETDLRGEDLSEALDAAGVESSLATGVPKAIDHYGTGTAYLEAVRSLAVEAVEQVAGERDSVGPLETLPDDETPTELGALPEVDISLDGFEPSGTVEEPGETETDEADAAETDEADAAELDVTAETAETETAESEATEAGETQPDTATEATETTETTEATEPDTETVESEPETEPESESEVEPEPETESEPESGGETESEPETETEPDDEESSPESDIPSEPSGSAAGGDELGDFDAESVQETVEQEAEELGDFDPADTVEGGDDDALTEEERAEVESEFGTEFSTGSEVGEPGEAGIDVPSSEEDLEELEDEVTGDDTESETTGQPPAAEPNDEAEPDEDVDLESAAVETMSELDDGDGVAHDAVVDAVVEEYDVGADAVEAAIQEAMMSGKCYEPGEGTLKAI